jgi:hypothetical protein
VADRGTARQAVHAEYGLHPLDGPGVRFVPGEL